MLENRIRRPFVASLLTVLLLFGAYFALFSPQFMTNDDVQMVLTASGQTIVERPSAQIQFTHIAIGIVLRELYVRFPDAAWYGWYMLGAHAVTHTALLYSFLILQPKRWRLLCYAVFFATLGVFFLNHLQFTSTAFLTCVAGLWLLLTAIERAESSTRRVFAIQCAAAVVLLLVSSMIRWHGFLFALVLTVPVLAFVAAGRRLRAPAVKVGVLLAAVCLVAFALRMYDRSAACRGADWSIPEQRRQLAKQLYDYHAVPYTDETVVLYEELGWSRTDFEMLMWSWYFDGDRFSAEKIEHLLSSYHRDLPFQVKNWLTAIFATVLVMAQRPHILFGLVIAVFAACDATIGRRHRLAVAGLCLSSLLVLAGLILVMRRVPDWVLFPAGSVSLLAALHFKGAAPFVSQAAETSRHFWRIGFVCLLASGCVWIAQRNWSTYRKYEARRNAFLSDLQALSPQEDELYYATIGFPWMIPVTQNDSGPSTFRAFYFGPPQVTPNSKRMLARFGIDDPYRAPWERDDVFVIVRRDLFLRDKLCRIDIEPLDRVYARYVKEHYGVDVRFVEHFRGRTFSAYRVVVGNTSRLQ